MLCDDCVATHLESRVRKISHGPRIGFDVTAANAAPYGRPAHRLGDCAGRSPGSRVSTFWSSLPGFPVASRGPRLAANSCGGSHGRPPNRQAFRVPSFVPGLRRGTSYTPKTSLSRVPESRSLTTDCPLTGRRCCSAAQRKNLLDRCFQAEVSFFRVSWSSQPK
jgi:hypothetical protein